MNNKAITYTLLRLEELTDTETDPTYKEYLEQTIELLQNLN